MAATAQDSTAPLRSGEGKKDEDREEESESPRRLLDLLDGSCSP